MAYRDEQFDKLDKLMMFLDKREFGIDMNLGILDRDYCVISYKLFDDGFTYRGWNESYHNGNISNEVDGKIEDPKKVKYISQHMSKELEAKARKKVLSDFVDQKIEEILNGSKSYVTTI